MRALLMQQQASHAQQQQAQEQQEQPWAMPGLDSQGWGQTRQRRMGFDPLAELLHPTISRNPHLAAAVGARSSGAGYIGGTNHNPTTALVQLISDVVHQAVHNSLGNAHPAAAAAATAAAGAAAGAAGPPVPPGGGAPGPDDGGGNAAAPVPPAVREVPKLGSWQSLPQLIKWYTEVGWKCSAVSYVQTVYDCGVMTPSSVLCGCAQLKWVGPTGTSREPVSKRSLTPGTKKRLTPFS